MKIFAQRYSTQLITGLFLISLISGVALFFHWESGIFHSMHEWLSMVLIVPFALHLWKHWRAMARYFQQRSMSLALALSVIAAAAFPLWPSSGSESGGRPEFGVINQISLASVAQVAPLFDLSSDQLIDGLNLAGFSTANTQSLRQIAENSGKSITELYGALLQIKP